jgi:enoyl-CoA hydratase/carnithine racemase
MRFGSSAEPTVRTATVKVECRDAVGWIILDHPPLNVVTAAMAREIRLAIDRLDADSACEPTLASMLTDLSGRLMDESIGLEDYAEGVEAFLEKRKPIWRHR